MLVCAVIISRIRTSLLLSFVWSILQFFCFLFYNNTSESQHHLFEDPQAYSKLSRKFLWDLGDCIISMLQMGL